MRANMCRTRLLQRAGWSDELNSVQASGFRMAVTSLCCIAMLLPGCVAHRLKPFAKEAHQATVEDALQKVEWPDTSLPTGDEDPAGVPQPRSLYSADPGDHDYWDLTIDEAIFYGLSNSRVLLDLGGTILRNPDAMYSNLTPAITQSDPRFGVEAALSAFDAQYNAVTNYENNDRALNNLFLSGGNDGRTFQQNLWVTRNEIVKRSAVGGQYAIRNFTEYDYNTAPSNLFPSAWTTWFEGEARQSLLQGAGMQFNRIAGPNATPGNYTGVTIARVNADISQADFEIALREYLSNLENAYWDLYFAYRELDGKLELRDMSLDILERFNNLQAAGKPNAEPYRVAQVREQYYRFEQDVQNSLTGRRLDGTRSYNGSPGGTFRATPGVYLAERRLRLMMGVPSTDARLIRPSDGPCLAEITLAWEMAKGEALSRRPELDRQRFRIKRAEMELVASRNFLLPRLDAVARYRFRGFGDDFINSSFTPTDPTVPEQRFNNAWGNLSTGDFQEWQTGVELSVPIGFRQGASAVANAEYRLARERAVLHQQERQLVHDLGNSFAELDRAYNVLKTTFDRRASAAEYLDGMRNKIDMGDFTPLDLEQWLESQRRFSEADSQYHLAVADYQVALKNVNYEKGSLLEFHNILATNANGSETTPSMPPAPAPSAPAAEEEQEIEG
jgi:hypothetical protein